MTAFWKQFDLEAGAVEMNQARPLLRAAFREQEKFVLERFDSTWRGASFGKQAQIDIETIFPEGDFLFQPLADALNQIVTTALQGWAAGAAETLGIATSFDLVAQATADYLREHGAEKVARINATTREALRSALANGVEVGEGLPKLRKRIESIFADARGRRSEVIARTETGSAASAGANEAYRQGNFPYKRWVTARDQRVRDNHQAAEGQIVAMIAPFHVGGYALMYPGDPRGPAAEVIQCRCIHVPEMAAEVQP